MTDREARQLSDNHRRNNIEATLMVTRLNEDLEKNLFVVVWLKVKGWMIDRQPFNGGIENNMSLGGKGLIMGGAKGATVTRERMTSGCLNTC